MTTVARRTQAQRSATTRAAVLRATVACLVELGYAGTTTAEVQARAGVSRGALTHHFPSKSALVLGAMDVLYDEFMEDVRSAAARLPQGSARLRPAVALIWARFDGTLFTAAMELWVAARTDAELRAALLPYERGLGLQLRRLCAEVLGPELSHHPRADVAYRLLLTSMRGQAMRYVLEPEAPRDERMLQTWYEMLEAFGDR